MNSFSDARLMAAKAIPILEVAERLGILSGLRRAGIEWVGPCPVCGGTDRFGINSKRDVFVCRHCSSGDQIKLVEVVLCVDFKRALQWLVGEADETLDHAEFERRRARAAEQQKKREADARKYRDQAIGRGRRIWAECQPAINTPVCDYLRRRGIGDPIASRPPLALRFHPALRYMVSSGHGGSGWECWHTGPAMVAGVLNQSGDLIAAHRTWIDLDQPNGKAVILNPVTGEVATDGKGKPLPVKKIEGSKKGGAIRLNHSTGSNFTTLVMGEGIETTLTAMLANAYPDAAYWAGVDLGNMSGHMARIDGVKWSGQPDMTDKDAFVPPPWIGRLIFIQDGDSEPTSTRAKLEAGLRRAVALNPRLVIKIAHAGEGVDLNDVLLGKG